MKIKFSEKQNFKNLIIFTNPKGELLVSNDWKKKNPKTADYLKKFVTSDKYTNSKNTIFHLFAPDLTEILLIAPQNNKKHPTFLQTGGQIGKAIFKNKIDDIAILFPGTANRNKELTKYLQVMIEGILMGLYQYQKPQAKPAVVPDKTLTICLKKEKSIDQQVKVAQILAESTNVARDCSNHPGNLFLPTDFKKACQAVAKTSKLKFEALTEAQMKKLGMNCLLGVSQGSDNPAFLNILTYETKKKKAPTLMLVGKGITFDAGGISLKSPQDMGLMKHDMSGGAAVLGAMRAIGLLKPDVNVIGLIPAVENLPDGKAIRPGDVLTACNGKTVEIISTDAEGRLILCDALAYGIKRFKPDAVADIATLTGACVVALGNYNIGMIPNQPQIAQKFKEAGYETGENVWEMPANDEYEEFIKSKCADIKNSGGRWGGMIYAGIFLRHFVGDTPWAHLDIAGVSDNVKHVDYHPDHGATGAGTRLLTQFVQNWS